MENVVCNNQVPAKLLQTASEETGQPFQQTCRSDEFVKLCMRRDHALRMALQAFAGDGPGAPSKPTAATIAHHSGKRCTMISPSICEEELLF